MQAPFEPAPVLVEIALPHAVATVADVLVQAASDERFIEPVGEERGLLRLGGGVLGDEVLLTGQRWTTRDTRTRTPQPLAFRGVLRPSADGAGSVLEGEIVAPIANILWLVPSASFAFGLIAALDGNLFGAIAGPVFALVTLGVFRVNQWDTLRDAAQLERGIRDLLAGLPAADDR